MRIIFNSKIEGIKILSEYFRKFQIKELKYYIENVDMSIPNFLQNNVYAPEDIELKNLFIKHFKIVIKKIICKNTELNFIREPIKISFISDLIYWNNLFVIKNNIFVSLQYLIHVFEAIEYNEYKNAEDIYIENNEIYDIKLLKNISKCIYSILQNLNKNKWIKFIITKFNCEIVSLSNIRFINKYNILEEPNVECMYGNIIIYWIDSNNIYGTFSSICSTDNSFSPYCEQIIIKLSYNKNNNIYTEIECIDIDKYEKKNLIKKMILNPFEYKAIEITNCII
jgi:hypothetical protein